MINRYPMKFPARRIQKFVRDNHLVGWLFILPGILGYLAFAIGPLVYSIILSFYEWDGLSPKRTWVGLNNFHTILKDNIFWLALIHNLIWLGLALVLSLGLGLLIAVILSQLKKYRTFFRVLFYLPNVLSLAIVALVWARIFDPFTGIFNYGLRMVGLGFLAKAWLGDPNYALPAVSIASNWHSFGWYMVIFLAGLQNINTEIYEAAEIDGANFRQKFWFITLPSLSNVINLTIFLCITGALQAYQSIWIMTQGGPYYHSELLGSYIYKLVFSSGMLGQGAAGGVVLGIIVLAITLPINRWRERSE